MEHCIGVAFSPNGTVSSTIVSFESLIRQIPNVAGRVSNVTFEDRWLRIELDEQEGISNHAVQQEGMCLSMTLKNLNLAAFKSTISEFMNRLFSLQVKYGGIYDVQNLALNEGMFSLDLKESAFRSKHEQQNRSVDEKEEESRQTKDPQKLIAAAGRLLLIDASNLINACYYASAKGKEEKDLMRSSAGEYTNAIKAMIDRFISIVRIYAPSHCALAIDSKRAELYRRDIYPGYKANRDGKEKPQSLEEQIPLAYELFEAMNIPQLKVERMEADDTIAALTKRWIRENRGDVIVLSNDKDLHQLLDGNVIQVLSGNVEVTRDSFIAKYGITPEQFADYKALCGEDGDNIPGVPGIGDKTALKLLTEYHSLEGVFANIDKLKGKQKENMEQHADDAKMSKLLAILYSDLPQLDSVNLDELAMKVNKDGMRRVLERLEINLSRSAA
jgi:5'-3' exonuclease